MHAVIIAEQVSRTQLWFIVPGFTMLGLLTLGGIFWPIKKDKENKDSDDPKKDR